MTDTYACGITAHRPTEDLYSLLGLDHGGAPIKGHHWLSNIREMSPSERYAYKALSDTYYKDVYDARYNTEDLFNAGFFDDGLPALVRDYPAYDPGLTTLPMGKLLNNLSNSSHDRDLAVLVTTGGMAPIHQGHVDMMNEARRQVELQGYEVVAGYMAPGHDSYVGQKYQGTAGIPAEHRCAMVELALQNSDWLDCDPWPARYMPAEINFTDVVAHIQEQLNFASEDHVSVFYVHGSDNPGFGAAMPGRTIMVERTALSSSMARQGHHDHLDPNVRDYLLSWNKPRGDALPYLIRNEEDESMATWNSLHDPMVLRERRIQLQSTIRQAISDLFKRTQDPRPVYLMPLSQQNARAQEVIGDRQVISLDPYFKNRNGITQHFGTTRYFELSGSQVKPIYRAERPGWADLKKQAALIPGGRYVLVEDDTVTGGTIACAMALLSQDVVIEEQVILSDFSESPDTEYHDVVDLRDFIIGSHHGGLGVLCDYIRARAPYVMPFVSLRARAKIPAEAELDLSLVIWRANERFFRDLNIKIQDCDEGFRRLAHFLGHDDQTRMEDFCRVYLKALMNRPLED